MLLASHDYSFSKCMLWGVCRKHFKNAESAYRQNLNERYVRQMSMAIATSLPIIGQVIALAGWILYRCFHFNKLPSIEGKVIRKLGGWNHGLQIELPNKQMVVWKESPHMENLCEVAGSSLANYLTGGLVPIARLGRRQQNEGTFQEYLDLDTSSFVSMTEREKVSFDFLNQNQKNQFFCHLIADRLVSNADTNQGQYGIEISTGKVISLDKGHAFRWFNLEGKPTKLGSHDLDGKAMQVAEKIHQLDLTTDYWFTKRLIKKAEKFENKKYVGVATAFAEKICAKKISISPEDKIIQDLFYRCHHIPKKCVEKSLELLANEMYPDRQQEFYDFVYNRIRSAPLEIARFFDFSLSAVPSQ